MADLNHRAAADVSLSSGHPGTEQDLLSKGIHFKILLPADQAAYFEACGRIRGLSYTAVIRRVLEEVTKSQLVASILDDDGKPAEKRHYERGPRQQSGPRKAGGSL